MSVSDDLLRSLGLERSVVRHWRVVDDNHGGISYSVSSRQEHRPEVALERAFDAAALPDGAVIDFLRAEWRSSRPPNKPREGLAWAQCQVGIRDGVEYRLSEPAVVEVPDDDALRDFSSPDLSTDKAGQAWGNGGPLVNFTVVTIARAENRSVHLLDPRLYEVRLFVAYKQPE